MRQYLLGAAILTCVLLCSCGSGRDSAAESRPAAPDRSPHCWFLRTGEIEAVIGDGAGIRIRPGLWSLSSIHYQFSIIKNMSSGILGGNMRNTLPVLEPIDSTSCSLRLEPSENSPTRSLATFRISSPYYLDYTLTFRDLQDRIPAGLDFRSVGWANYMNSPDDLRMHFISGGGWMRFIPEEHGGAGSDIAPSYIPDSDLETWPAGFGDPSFWWYKRNDKRFDEPFFCGRFRDMVAIWVFDTPRWLRLFGSPAGGGESLIPGSTSPAWDFEYIIPRKDYEVNRDYTFRVRLIFKKFVDDDDVLREVRKAQDDLGFEKAPSPIAKPAN